MLGLAVFFGAREAGIEGFERRAARAVAERLDGPDRKVKVVVRTGLEWGRVDRARITASQFSLDGLPLFTEPDRSQFGKLSLLELRLSDFRLRGLQVQELTADIRGSRFDLGAATGPGELVLSKSGVGRGQVAVRQEDLAAWIPSKVREIKSCTVTLADGQATVAGDGEFLIVKTPFRVQAALEVREGSQVWLTRAKIWFRDEAVEGPAAEAVLKVMNPIIDLNKDLGLAGAIAVDTLTLSDGLLTAAGEVRIPERPGTGPATVLN
jgi:hypothetical protein